MALPLVHLLSLAGCGLLPAALAFRVPQRPQPPAEGGANWQRLADDGHHAAEDEGHPARGAAAAEEPDRQRLQQGATRLAQDETGAARAAAPAGGWPRPPPSIASHHQVARGAEGTELGRHAGRDAMAGGAFGPGALDAAPQQRLGAEVFSSLASLTQPGFQQEGALKAFELGRIEVGATGAGAGEEVAEPARLDGGPGGVLHMDAQPKEQSANAGAGTKQRNNSFAAVVGPQCPTTDCSDGCRCDWYMHCNKATGTCGSSFSLMVMLSVVSFVTLGCMVALVRACVLVKEIPERVHRKP